MKRILVLLTVVALMVAMMAVAVSPAFARGNGTQYCIQFYYSIGYSHGEAAQICNR